VNVVLQQGGGELAWRLERGEGEEVKAEVKALSAGEIWDRMMRRMSSPMSLSHKVSGASDSSPASDGQGHC